MTHSLTHVGVYKVNHITTLYINSRLLVPSPKFANVTHAPAHNILLEYNALWEEPKAQRLNCNTSEARRE